MYYVARMQPNENTIPIFFSTTRCHLWVLRKFIFDQYVFASLKVSEQIIQNTLLRQRLSQLSLSIFDILYTINLKPLKTYFDI